MRRAGRRRQSAAEPPGTATLAVEECLSALRAACRRPIDSHGLDTLVGWLRPQFDLILNDPAGAARWADHGHIMHDNARHIGALADFLAYRADAAVVGIRELTEAFEMVRAACKLRVTRSENAAAEDAGEP